MGSRSGGCGRLHEGLLLHSSSRNHHWLSLHHWLGSLIIWITKACFGILCNTIVQIWVSKNLVHLLMERWWAILWSSIIELHIKGHAVKGRNYCLIEESKEDLNNEESNGDQHEISKDSRPYSILKLTVWLFVLFV